MRARNQPTASVIPAVKQVRQETCNLAHHLFYGVEHAFEPQGVQDSGQKEQKNEPVESIANGFAHGRRRFFVFPCFVRQTLIELRGPKRAGDDEPCRGTKSPGDKQKQYRAQ